MTTSITVPSSMKALVKAKREPGLWLENVPVPPIGPNDLLIRVKKAAICGTDKHIYDWDHWAQATIPVPMAVGHEFMGDVVRIGTAVAGFEIGDRVSGEGHITCGHCRRCRAGTRHLCRNAQGLGVNRPGCFADYVSLPAVNAFKLPAKLSDEVASFLDPLGNAVHTALAFSVVGEDVLITGAGPIGCMAAAVCRHVGARHIVVTDLNPYRLSIASKMGADRVVSPEDEDLDDVMRELGMKEGFDVGLEMSGSAPALRSMLEVTNHGAKMALLGIPPDAISIDWTKVVFKGLTLKGIYGREMFDTWYKMASLLESGLAVTPVLTHRVDVERYEDAFRHMQAGDCGKIILNWAS